MAKRASAGRAAPVTCAHCGASIPRAAKACPECGADETTGWRETDLYDGLDLPDEAWQDDDASVPLSAERRGPQASLPWYWWATGLMLLIGGVLWVLGLV